MNCLESAFRLSALHRTTWRLKIDEVIKATQRQIEQIDVVSNVLWQEARCQGEAPRDAIDRCLRIGEERRHARIALDGHAVTGEPDFRLGLLHAM